MGLVSVFETLPWGIGIAEMSPTFKTQLQTGIEDAGLDWAADFEPYVVALTASFDGATSYELGYMLNYETQCDDIVLDGKGLATALPAPTAPPLAGYFEGYSYYVFGL